VALLALTLQLGLAFGHVHVAPASATTLSVAASPQSDTGDPDDADHCYCATCAVLALLTGAQTATAPDIVQSVSLVSTEITLQPETISFFSSHAAFRSRAPPLS
jgi:hypothetical protein